VNTESNNNTMRESKETTPANPLSTVPFYMPCPLLIWLWHYL